MATLERKYVLVVGNENHFFHEVLAKLRNSGFRVINTTKPGEAFMLTISKKPGIIISDSTMPEMYGVELIGALRQTRVARSIPAILLATKSFSITSEEQIRLQIGWVFNKPIDLEELLEKVRELILRR